MENILMKSFVILSWGLFPQQRAFSLVNSQSRETDVSRKKSLARKITESMTSEGVPMLPRMLTAR